VWYGVGMTSDSDTRDTLPGSLDALTEVLYSWDRYTSADNPLSQAKWLIHLQDNLSDLRSFHPDWEWETGTMPWDREEG
jgi:hypothetical protein